MLVLLVIIAVFASIILMVATLKYPSISLVFLLMAGTLKGLLAREFRFVGFLDPVILGAIWVLLAMMYNFVKTGKRLRDIITIPFVIYATLAAFLLFGLVYTSAPIYGFQKSIRFATIVLIMFLAPVVLVSSLKDLKLIIGILFFMSIVYAIGTIIAPHAALMSTAGLDRAAFAEAGPLATAGILAMGVIIAFCLAIAPHALGGLKRLGIVMIPVMLIAMVWTGSRGPFFGLWLCVLAALFIYRKHVSKIWLVVVVATTVIATSLIFIKLPYETTIRIGGVVMDKYETEKLTSVRTEMFRWAWENAKKRLIFGHGTGAYAVDRNGVDTGDWPHNIILELLYEQGLVGVALISLFIWLILWRWRQASKLTYLCEPYMHKEASHILHIAGLLFLFNLLQAMKSFDIVGNRWMFFSAGLVLAAFNCIRQATEEMYVEGELITNAWQQSEEGGFQDAEVLYRC